MPNVPTVSVEEVQEARSRVITYSVLEPVAVLSDAERRAIREAALDSALVAAKNGLKGSNIKLTVRDLFPSDLGETNEQWADQTGTSANVWENSIIASETVADERFIAIYGVLDNSEIRGILAGLRFTFGRAIRAQWSLFKLASDDNRIEGRTAYARSPIVLTQNTPFTIEMYLSGTLVSTSQSVSLHYLGYVVEKSGKVITP